MGFKVEFKDHTKRVATYQDVTCDRCGKTPPKQGGGATNELWLQYDNVLILNLIGGYGMFTDPDPGSTRSETFDPETTKILCHECAHEFAKWLDWDVHNSHTHVAAEHGGTQHSDHHDPR